MAITNKLRIFGEAEGDVFNDWNNSEISTTAEHKGAVPGDIIYAREINTALRNASLITYALVDAIKDGTSNNKNITDSPTQDWTPTTPYDDTFKTNFSTSLRKFIYEQRVNYANNLTSAVTINIKDNSGAQIATGTFSAAGTTVNLQLSNTLDMNKSGSNGSITSYSFYGTTLGDKNNLFTDAYVTNYYGTNVGTNTSKITTGYITTLNSTTGNITTVNANSIQPSGSNNAIGASNNFWSNAYITTLLSNTIGNKSNYVSEAYITTIYGNLNGTATNATNAINATNATNDADSADIRAAYAHSLTLSENDGVNTIKLNAKHDEVLSTVNISKVATANNLSTVTNKNTGDNNIVSFQIGDTTLTKNVNNVPKATTISKFDASFKSGLNKVRVNNGSASLSTSEFYNRFYFMMFESDAGTTYNFGIVFLGIENLTADEHDTETIYLVATSSSYTITINYIGYGIDNITFKTSGASGYLYYMQLSAY